MIATLQFELPDEREEFDDACRAGEYAAALHDIRETLYRADEYDIQSLVAALFDALDR